MSLLDDETLLPQEDEQEMFEHFRLVADKGQAPLRVDKFITTHQEDTSRNRVQQAIKLGYVLVNDKPAKANTIIRPCDVIKFVMPYQRRGVEIIDKDTSGLLVVAKNPQSQAHLADQFFEHSIDRVYTAVVWGNLAEDSGTISGTIGRDPNDRLRFRVYDDPEKGKWAVTHWRVLERYGFITVVECLLETGRTHQIRVHMASIGHPLFNDERYGGAEIRQGTIYAKYRQFIQNCFALCPRQALHARTLGFTHPRTGERIFLEAPLPADMTALIEKWRAYVAAMK